jgi:hypothetical protein
MSKRTYSERWCCVCGQSISAAGAAWAAHCKMHVKEERMVAIPYYHRTRYSPALGVQIIPPPKRQPAQGKE